ncbi:MAG TPA: hypothetical protein VHD83_26085 [Puia sp.]|nr:hypothetical protein [Puia sp.]
MSGLIAAGNDEANALAGYRSVGSNRRGKNVLINANILIGGDLTKPGV